VLAVLTLALSIGAALVVAGGGGENAAEREGRPSDVTTTTLRAGDVAVVPPAGWLAVPLPSLGFGLAVPPGWEATRTDSGSLTALERGSLANPGFVDSARNAADAGAALYAAHQDRDGRVSDVKVQVLPRPGATSPDVLRQLADRLVAETPLAGAEVRASSGEEGPEVHIRYPIAGSPSDTGAAVGTQVLRAGTDRIVSLIVTSEDPPAHDELVRSIVKTLRVR
jgi:hypothetical protein